MSDKKKVIAVSSIKGGVGKTTLTVNLGCAFARQFNKHTIIVDANLSAPNLGIHFGYIDIEKTIHDVLDRKAKFHEAIYEYDSKIHVMPGIIKGKFSRQWSLSGIISDLKKHYDIIIIDTSPSLDELEKVIDVVDEIIFVATPDYPTLSTTLQLINFLDKKVPVAGLVLNMVRSKKFELSEKDLHAASNVPILASVPYNIAIPKSIAELKPLYFYSPKHKLSKAYTKIAAAVLGENVQKKSLLDWIRSLRHEAL